MASLGLCIYPLQNDKSSTPGLKSNTPTPRNDAPTPGTSTTPGLRSMPGKPPGMDPIGIMGRHDGAGLTMFEGRGSAPGQGWSLTDGGQGGGSESGLSQGPSLGDLVRFEKKVSAWCFNTDVRAYWSHCALGVWKEFRTGQDTNDLSASAVSSVRL